MLAGWLMLAGVLFGIWCGRRAGKRRAESIRAEAFAAGGKAALTAALSQTVIVGSQDMRRADVRLDSTDNGAADGSAVDPADYLAASYDRSIARGADGPAHPRFLDGGAPVVLGGDLHGLAGPQGAPVTAGEIEE